MKKFLLGALLLWLTGCAALQGAATAADKARANLDCRVAVLEPYLGDQARQAVVDTLAGKLDPVPLLLSLDVTPADIVKIAKDFRACSAAPDSEPDPEPLQTL